MQLFNHILIVFISVYTIDYYLQEGTGRSFFSSSSYCLRPTSHSDRHSTTLAVSTVQFARTLDRSPPSPCTLSIGMIGRETSSWKIVVTVRGEVCASHLHLFHSIVTPIIVHWGTLVVKETRSTCAVVHILRDLKSIRHPFIKIFSACALESANNKMGVLGMHWTRLNCDWDGLNGEIYLLYLIIFSWLLGEVWRYCYEHETFYNSGKYTVEHLYWEFLEYSSHPPI